MCIQFLMQEKDLASASQASAAVFADICHILLLIITAPSRDRLCNRSP